jgi:hypothetical protein
VDPTTERGARAAVTAGALGRCELCGRSGPTSWAHRVARGQGGRWTPANGVLLCGDGVAGCHGWTHAHPDAARAGGWILPAGTDPTTAPVWLRSPGHGTGWFLLTDDGSTVWVDPVDAGLPDVPAALPPSADDAGAAALAGIVAGLAQARAARPGGRRV